MRAAVALGNFDGVHIAHKRIIENAVLYAKRNCIKSIVYMFEIHPRIVLGDRDFKVITDNCRKRSIISSLGADHIYYESSTCDIMKMSPEVFVKEVLLGVLEAGYVSVGYNYRFGKGGKGDAYLLKDLGKKYGFKVEITDNITFCGKSVSSSLLRDYISLGEVGKANSLMCEPYAVCGTVSEGKHLGGVLGAATANVEIPDSLLTPKNGVYRTKTLVEGTLYGSITNIGTNPTVENAKTRSETHIIDYCGDIYGKRIDVLFYEFIRPEFRFGSVDELTAQIKKDIEFVKKSENRCSCKKSVDNDR